MRKSITMLSLLLLMSYANAAEQMLYQLKQVTSITPREKYVFVSSATNVALKAEVIDSALQTIASFNTSSLTGDELYVWKYKVLSGPMPYLQNGTNCLRSAATKLNSSDNVVLEKNAMQMNISFDSNGLATIKAQIVPGKERTLCSTNTTTGTEYKFYTYAKNNYKFKVYQLEEMSYTREVIQGTLGTLCVPFATTSATGADFYEILYKEQDGSGNPTQLYYQQVAGGLEAGKAYVFVPTASQISLTAQAGSLVDTPLMSNGLMGTFTAITDGTDATKNTLQGNYIVYNNTFQKCGTDCNMAAYRAYIKMNEVPTQEQATAPTRQVMVLGEKSQPVFYDPLSTGCNALPSAVPSVHKRIINGQLIIQKGNNCYNTLGQQL